jgi:hypothetical protein
MAQTRGPARIIPAKAVYQFSIMGAPEDTTPQANAHIGGNQVIGFKSSKTADGTGYATFDEVFSGVAGSVVT